MGRELKQIDPKVPGSSPPPPEFTVLTPEVQKIILDALKAGNFLRTACDIAGISYQIYRRWQARWEKKDPKAMWADGFFREVIRATAMGEAFALSQLRTGGLGWQAQAWFLERRFPGRWAKKDRVIVQGVDVSKMTDDELKTVRDSAKKGG